MARVSGIGGVFFKSRDPKRLSDWYRIHLEVDVKPWGGAAFEWSDPQPTGSEGVTAWNVFDSASDYFSPSEASFMVNYRVADLHAVLASLRAEGCNVLDNTDESEYGKFGWVIDPDGNKVELWEAPVAA